MTAYLDIRHSAQAWPGKEQALAEDILLKMHS